MTNVASYTSPKADKGQRSVIEGRGLFANSPIGQGEIVAIKGGHVVDTRTLEEHAAVIGNSDIKIADGFHIAALSVAEYEDVMLFLNHSCEPNVGLGGNIVFVAMRDIAAGEELTIDYAMIDDDDTEMLCRCGHLSCRGIVTGRDWRRPDLQVSTTGIFPGICCRRCADDVWRRPQPSPVSWPAGTRRWSPCAYAARRPMPG